MPEVSPARTAALAALTRWREAAGRAPGGGKAEDIIRAESGIAGLDRRDRALALEMFYGVIRNLTLIDHFIGEFISPKNRKVDPAVRDTLRLAAYQILFLDRVPPHAAVNEAVEQAKRLSSGAGSFVNAVLRSLIRGAKDISLPESTRDPAAYLCIKYSFPRWIASRWVTRFGKDGAERLMAASNSVPPITLRVNTLKSDRDGLSELLRSSGNECEFTKYAPDGLTVHSEFAVHELPGYAEGLFSVQDEASQLVSVLLGPKPGDTVLDACAAPGGKTAHIFALAGGKAYVVAADIGLDKLGRLNENIARLGVPGVGAVAADAAVPPFRPVFDRILLDAPCSALGIIRRRPEIKHVRTQRDVDSLARTQIAILRAVSGLLKPGGVVVYSTCSTEPDEGERVIGRFMDEHKAFELQDAGEFLPEPAHDMLTGEGFMRSYPHIHGTDGFFAARMIKRA